MMTQSWMGTDFTNDDLVKESSIVTDYIHRLLGEEAVDGRPCYRIELLPRPEAAVVWGKVLVWIDTQDYLQLRSEFYDEDGQLVNTMHGSDIRLLGSPAARPPGNDSRRQAQPENRAALPLPALRRASYRSGLYGAAPAPNPLWRPFIPCSYVFHPGLAQPLAQPQPLAHQHGLGVFCGAAGRGAAGVVAGHV
ncbi:outer membrane lipoprotein-sorting protein [Hymenobacter sp. BT188]|uniref:outer membrane lipoprotein-sorting protein n=1 Tax=Hymenobacter sp. BT188 TaxID=2763504 RepID=UPI0021C5C9F5|nr:outer membrane lipoprotein-sorting protein [Hymenobacter sp. BT188]